MAQFKSERVSSLFKLLDKKDKKSIMEWLQSEGSPKLEKDVLDFVEKLLEGEYLRSKDFIPGKKVGNWEVKETPGNILSHNGMTPVTPDAILRMGVFGGNYLNSFISEIPIEWTLLIASEGKLKLKPDSKINHYGVISSQSMTDWGHKGWSSDNDPAGWFQWHIRYYLGRRTDNDTEQIKRWYRFIRRHLGQIRLNTNQKRSKQKQACLQWAYFVDTPKK